VTEGKNGRKSYRTKGRGKLPWVVRWFALWTLKLWRNSACCGAAAFWVMRDIEQEEIRKREKSNLIL